MHTALPLILFYNVTNPIMWAFNHSTSVVFKAFGIAPIDEQEAAHTDALIEEKTDLIAHLLRFLIISL